MSNTPENAVTVDDLFAEMQADDDTPDEYEEAENDNSASESALGLVYQHHQDNNSYDQSAFWKMVDSFHIKNRAERDEPGDMAARGIWERDFSFMWQPFSQMSCAYGLAVVENTSHLDKVSDLVKKHGRIFLFTVVRETLLKAVQARPDDFKILCTTESWMSGNNNVYLVAALDRAEKL